MDFLSRDKEIQGLHLNLNRTKPFIYISQSARPVLLRYECVANLFVRRDEFNNALVDPD